MSKKLWQAELKPILTLKNKRLIIVGMGHLLRGDDAVGLYVIQQLESIIPKMQNILLLNAGSAPENMTGKIRQFMPDIVLFIDSAEMQQEAGHIQLIDLNSVGEVAASTHTLSLRLLSSFLHHEIGCDVLLLGIQPQKAELLSPLSLPVENGVNAITEFICENIHE